MFVYVYVLNSPVVNAVQLLMLFAFSRLSQRPTARELEDKHILLSMLSVLSVSKIKSLSFLG